LPWPSSSSWRPIILRTAVAPTWTEIGQLAAIVVLRTVLNYFLQQEIDKAQVRSPAHVG